MLAFEVCLLVHGGTSTTDMQLNLGGEAKPVQPQSERTTAPCHKRREKATYFILPVDFSSPARGGPAQLKRQREGGGHG